MSKSVALVGGSGKLGRVVADVVTATPGFEVSSALDVNSELSEIGSADLIIDTSRIEVSREVLRYAIENKKNLIIGTSGWSEEQLAPLRDEISDAGISVIVVPNFSLGSVLGSAIAAKLAEFYDFVEIVETHRDTKVDSPSGTAVRTAELISEARTDRGAVKTGPMGDAARGELVAGVPVHSLRRPGVIARQEVWFSGPGETLTLVHDTVDPAAAYGPGIRLALINSDDAPGLVVGLDSFLELF